MIPVILGTAAAGILLIEKLDQCIEPSAETKAGVLAAGLAGSGLLQWILGPGESFSRLLLALLLGCLLLACVTDVAINQVHNFVWWIGGASSAVLLWERLWMTGSIQHGVGMLFGLAIFWMVQLGLFGRLYGKADCYAFCVCAIAETGLGMGLTWVVIQMAFAFSLLVPVQFIRKNITLGGNLKKPVPFLPYITAAFYLLLVFAKICGEIVVPLS